jgi:hypothetical protein
MKQYGTLYLRKAAVGSRCMGVWSVSKTAPRSERFGSLHDGATTTHAGLICISSDFKRICIHAK